MYELYSLLQDFLILDTKIVAYSAGTLSVMPERELGNQAQILKYSPCSCSLYVHILYVRLCMYFEKSIAYRKKESYRIKYLKRQCHQIIYLNRQCHQIIYLKRQFHQIIYLKRQCHQIIYLKRQFHQIVYSNFRDSPSEFPPLFTFRHPCHLVV